MFILQQILKNNPNFCSPVSAGGQNTYVFLPRWEFLSKSGLFSLVFICFYSHGAVNPLSLYLSGTHGAVNPLSLYIRGGHGAVKLPSLYLSGTHGAVKPLFLYLRGANRVVKPPSSYLRGTHGACKTFCIITHARQSMHPP